MQDEHIHKTFSVIRNLPPQVAYESIQQLVLSQPPAIYIHHNHLWFNLKNIIIMTTSVSVISALLLFNYSSNVQPSQPVKEQKKEIIKKEIVLPQQDKLSGQPVAKTAVIPLPIEEKKKAKPAPVFTAMQTVTPAPKNVIETPKTQEPPVIADSGEPEASAPPVAALIPDCNSHTPFPCNCPCNDGNNVTCTFKEKLLDDEIISDTEKFSFKLDGKSFTVNGKEQPENIFKKYSRIYKELTGKKLNEGSSMTVSVEKGNCSINISTND